MSFFGWNRYSVALTKIWAKVDLIQSNHLSLQLNGNNKKTASILDYDDRIRMNVINEMSLSEFWIKEKISKLDLLKNLNLTQFYLLAIPLHISYRQTDLINFSKIEHPDNERSKVCYAKSFSEWIKLTWSVSKRRKKTYKRTLICIFSPLTPKCLAH